ncbi:MAG TPA: NAD(P)-dependent oxidoreductase [Sphingobium sp.]|uniref:NAD(P)-dependent oxidoreductase n=1 Tax=Sphingobium sp. TaxID=1912891 RepID=UPI002ED2225F
MTGAPITIGFIGLGSQGEPMARRIVDAGFQTVLWARRPEALTSFADTAARTASSVAELGAQCGHVGICVVDDAGTLEICDALIPAMLPGSRIAIHSTILPETCRQIADKAGARGITVIDAPVSGGAPAASAGKLTVMVGASEEALAAAWPIFASFAGLIVHLGDVGTGQMAKIINNSLMAAHVALAHHALDAGDLLGLDRTALVELVRASSGRSFGFEIYARMPSPGAFASGGKLLDKDVRLLGAILEGRSQYPPFRDLALPFLAEIARDAANATAG